MTRRQLIEGTLGIAAASSLAGCGAVTSRFLAKDRKVSLPKLDVDPNRRLLDRISFGATDQSLLTLNEIGRDAFLTRELEAKTDEDPFLIASLRRFDVTQTGATELMDLPRERVIEQLHGAALMRSVYSRNQLKERMIDFWSNHFNVFSRKGDGAFYKGVTEERVIRTHALGNFKDLLSGIAHSPSMLIYLDNDRNHKGHSNENYARELLELHTLGVHGGYTQHDIQEVARCLSGWTVENRFLHPRGQFWFNEGIHDNGSKQVLGHTIPANGGKQDGETVLEIVANHPSTAKFIAQKLVAYFIGPSETALIEEVAKEFTRTGGDLRKTLAVVVHSPKMTDSAPQIRKPFEYVSAALRVTNARTDGGKPLQDHLRAMGQPLYEWPMPDGYPVKTQNWLGSMLPRWNFAAQLCKGGIGGTSINSKNIELLNQAQDTEQIALYLASPQFQWM